jgi:hypothetical protein
LREAERLAEESKAVAANTNLQIHAQGEQLDRMHKKAKHINGVLVKSEESAKEITSFWYYMKNKVKKAFGINKNGSKETEE